MLIMPLPQGPLGAQLLEKLMLMVVGQVMILQDVVGLQEVGAAIWLTVKVLDIPGE